MRRYVASDESTVPQLGKWDTVDYLGHLKKRINVL
jgi:hypothetical protein